MAIYTDSCKDEGREHYDVSVAFITHVTLEAWTRARWLEMKEDHSNIRSLLCRVHEIHEMRVGTYLYPGRVDPVCSNREIR